MRDIVSEIIRRVDAERKLLAATVAAGQGVSSYDQYQRLVGRGEGFSLALELINEILTEDSEAE